MAIKIDGQDLLKKFIGWQEIVRIYKNGGEIRPNTVPPVLKPWLCFTANTAGSTLRLHKYWSPTVVSLEISTDWETWTTYLFWTLITLSNIWDKIYWRNTSETTTWFSTGWDHYEFFMNWSISASWDVTSLINKNCTDTILTDGSYYRLFHGCASLTTAPQLPATTLTENCYLEMFRYCTSLTTAPQLPATTLADGCYDGMFDHCESLETLPQLPATTLADNCYSGMFYECTSIKLSETQTWEYQTPYRIPASWTWTVGAYSLDSMFLDTWWTWEGTPNINQTYYTSNTVI